MRLQVSVVGGFRLVMAVAAATVDAVQHISAMSLADQSLGYWHCNPCLWNKMIHCACVKCLVSSHAAWA